MYKYLTQKKKQKIMIEHSYKGHTYIQFILLINNNELECGSVYNIDP